MLQGKLGVTKILRVSEIEVLIRDLEYLDRLPAAPAVTCEISEINARVVEAAYAVILVRSASGDYRALF